ncbi:MAG: peptidylprolyl isomerase [Armatimonadota bacterium]|nr:peptidylprolyl isomerase [Armatimonadota bacterium]MCX7778199.1 peptidylprolyl isomerase [Armatimonadota bacterium]MDW8025687.1 peptidylprolyl isomerase [Armatimonadota bacterium]
MCIKRVSIAVCFAVCMFIDVSKCGEPAFIKRYYDVPEIIATVDGEPIKREDFVARLICDHGNEVLRSMITLKLIEQEAKRRGISVTDREVLERFNTLFEALEKGDTERLVRAGLPVSITPMMLWAEAKKFLLLERLLKGEIRIDEADIRKRWYTPHIQRRYNPPPMYEVREIGVYTAEEANNLWGELIRAQKARRDLTKVFSELAAKHSKLPTARLQGSRGYLAVDELPQEYKLILRAAKPGEIFPPMQVAIDGIYYWVIVWVRDIKEPPRVSYEEAKREIEMELFTEQLALRSREFIRGLWEKALKDGKVKVMAEPLRESFEKGLLGEQAGVKTDKLKYK